MIKHTVTEYYIMISYFKITMFYNKLYFVIHYKGKLIQTAQIAVKVNLTF